MSFFLWFITSKSGWIEIGTVLDVVFVFSGHFETDSPCFSYISEKRDFHSNNAIKSSLLIPEREIGITDSFFFWGDPFQVTKQIVSNWFKIYHVTNANICKFWEFTRPLLQTIQTQLLHDLFFFTKLSVIVLALVVMLVCKPLSFSCSSGSTETLIQPEPPAIFPTLKQQSGFGLILQQICSCFANSDGSCALQWYTITINMYPE